MARKNIFQLVEENYDVQSEIEKIDRLFTNEPYFEINYICPLSFKKIVKSYLFHDWKYRGTCISVEEYFERAEADLSVSSIVSEECIINYLEIMENFVKLYMSNADFLQIEKGVGCDNKFITVYYDLIRTLEKRMGLTTREYKDKVIIYPKNAPLEQVVDLCEDEDVQWELIRYVREDLSLSEKRKSLAYLATNLYIEYDKTETNAHLKELLNKAENILNNLHIRHNNKTGKWENEIIETIDEKDALSLCDMVYNEMLTIVLLREHKKYDPIYAEFNTKQKATRTKKKAEDEDNG